MPHDKISEMTGSKCPCHMKGSPLEHDPHAYAHAEQGEEKAAQKVQHLMGMKH